MSGFRFKQFYIDQQDAAMKVGTDGILLGAWADLEGCQRILDIGTGTGLLALMAKQRQPEAEVTALEIDASAARCAAANVAASPWPDIDVLHSDVADYETERRFDLVISNPPYFVDSLKSPDPRRLLARHTDSLGFADLLGHFVRLTHDNGRMALVLPIDALAQMQTLLPQHGLAMSRLIRVKTTIRKPSGRILLELVKQHERPCIEDEICIHGPDGGYSEDYILLCKAFYLKMPD